MQRAWSIVAIVCAACATTAAPTSSTTTVTAAELTRERDDAQLRATAAETVATRAKSECENATRELEKLRERDNFEQSIWIRLNQSDLVVHSLADLLPQALQEQRKTIHRAIGESLTLRGVVEQKLRMLHAVPDAEWRQFEHDLDAAMDDLERALHPLL